MLGWGANRSSRTIVELHCAGCVGGFVFVEGGAHGIQWQVGDLRMRIALLNRQFAPVGGGGERYAWNLAGQLARRGHEVHAFCGAYDSPQPGVVLHPVAYATFPRFRRITSFAGSARRELNRCRHLNFDVTYALSPVFGVDAFYVGGGSYLHWQRIHRPNLLCRWFHALINPSTLAQVVCEQKVMRESAHLVAVSNLVRTHLLELGVAQERMAVLYTGYFPEEFNGENHEELRQAFRAGNGLEPEAPVGLLIGNYWRRKGLDVTLQALPSVVRDFPAFRLVVVGKGDVAHYTRMARTLGVEKHLVFAGEIDRPAAAFHAADFLVFPGMYDPGGAVIIESMACGIPVIASACCGNSELLAHGTTGWVLRDWSDAQTLAEHIRSFCRDPQKTKSMGAAATEAAKQYAFNHVVDQYVELFSRWAKSR